MADDDAELSKMLPRWAAQTPWPVAIPEKNRLRLQRKSAWKSEPALRNYVPTSRDRMVDYINRTFYDDGREGRKYAERVMNILDFIPPVGVGNQTYNTTRALGEGRFMDAAIESGLAFLPGLRKVRGLHNPIPMPPRSIWDDYPHGAPVYEGGDDFYKGYLTHDMDGRSFLDEEGTPNFPAYQVGRTRADSPDHALTPTDIQRAGEHIMGQPIVKKPEDKFPPETLGQTWLHPLTGKPFHVQILDSLPQADADMVTAHEVGHVIDISAGEIPTEGLDDELDFLFNALSSGKEQQKFRFLQHRPEDFGYSGPEAAREKMAEAVRAYMVDPNYLKTMAPKTAARIREWAYSHPEVSNVVRFNSLAAGVGATGLAGQSEDSEAGEITTDRRQQASNPLETKVAPDGKAEIAKLLAERSVSPQAPKTGPLSDIARILADLKARQKPQSYGGPR